MGNYPSKPTSREESLYGVYDMADEAHETKFEGDPRSPTVDIDRTPLQKHGVANAKPITKNVDLTKECFDKCEKPMLNPALRTIMNQIDPRSPTIDFQRTPLGFIIKNPELMLAYNQLNSSNFLDGSDLQSNEALEDSNTGIITNLEPKNLCQELCNLSVQSENDKFKATEIDVSICNSNNKVKEDNIIVDDVREDLLTSDHNEINKPIYGLLETNLDYIETDLDTVRRKRKVITKPENIMSENSDIEKESSAMENDIEMNKDLSGKDPRSPSVGIDRTPILITENRNKEVKSIKSNKKPNSQMKEVFRNNVKLQKRMLSDEKLQDKNIIKKITDSLLIYEDTFPDSNNTSFNSKKGLNIQSNDGSRTPLACMMNIDNSYSNSKQNTPSNEQNVFDPQMKSNKPTNAKSKIPVRVSKISPTLHNTANIKCSDFKNIKSHRMVQCDSENTPPQPRKACWDTDNSVVL